MSRYCVYVIVKRAFKKADIMHKKLSPDSFRRTYASFQDAMNVPINKIRILLGHSNI